MNLDNPFNTVALRGLIERVGSVTPETATAVVAALHAEGYGIVHAPCADCRKVHQSYPAIRAFHSPCCATWERGECAYCKAPLGKPADIVGEVCDRCAYGEPCE